MGPVNRFRAARSAQPLLVKGMFRVFVIVLPCRDFEARILPASESAEALAGILLAPGSRKSGMLVFE